MTLGLLGLARSFFSKTWSNYGDVNPREEGGLFIRYLPQRKEFEVVQTDNLIYHLSKRELRERGKYMIRTVTVSLEDILDQSVMGYVGVDRVESGNEVVCILGGWIPYHGAHFSEDTNNYWRTLEKYGIYPNHG